jgi:hypothetical protein
MKWKFVHSLLLCILAGAALQFAALDYQPVYNRVKGDGLAYYSYLPAWFIYKDFDNSFYSELSQTEKSKYWLNEGVDGGFLPKMTMGLALLWAPFYGLADLIAPVFDYPQDGWSAPYLWSINLSALLALLIGSWAVFSFLNKRFSKFLSALCVILLVFGTNLLHYAVSEVSMSHVYSFALCASTLFIFDKWIVENKGHQLALGGFLFGLMVLIRPTNIVLILVPIVSLSMKSELLNRIKAWQVLVASLFFILPIIPQLLFWKITSGAYLHYSYPDEKFFWFNPHLIEGFFSYRNGWLVYSSVFGLMVPGFFMLRKIDKDMAWSGLILLIAHSYVTFSWWCWYYGDSFSIRPMIDIYPVLALPLAGGLYWIGQRVFIFKYFLAALTLLLTYNNLLFISHYHDGIITGSTMTKTVFWGAFLNPSPSNHFNLTLDYHQPDNESLRAGKTERSAPDTALIEAIQLPSQMQTTDTIIEKLAFGPARLLQTPILETHQDQYLRFTYSIQLEGYPESYPILVFEFVNDGTTMDYHALELEYINLDPFEENITEVFLKSPDATNKHTSLKTYYWNKNQGRGIIKLLNIEKVRIAFSEAN